MSWCYGGRKCKSEWIKELILQWELLQKFYKRNNWYITAINIIIGNPRQPLERFQCYKIINTLLENLTSLFNWLLLGGWLSHWELYHISYFHILLLDISMVVRDFSENLTSCLWVSPLLPRICMRTWHFTLRNLQGCLSIFSKNLTSFPWACHGCLGFLCLELSAAIWF